MRSFTRLTRLSWVLAAVAVLGAAAPETSPAAKAPTGPDARSLREAENGFAQSVREKNRTAFAAAIAEDAIFVSGEEVLRGKAAIVEAWSGLFSPEAPPMDWHPTIAEVEDGGALGMTRGPWTISGKDKDGKPAPRSGVFNSVWRKDAAGSWKVVFDMGCPPCPCAKP